GEFATVGGALPSGRVPYVELSNPEPPAVFYVDAAAMAILGQTTEALRAIDIVFVPVISAALYGIGSRLAGRRTGLWAALLLPVFYFTETFWTLTQNDGIALLPMALAMYAMVRAAEGGQRAWLWALAGGALCGWALWFKYPFILFAGAVIVNYLLLRPRGSRLWKPLAAFLGGGLATGLGGVGLMAAQGALNALIESALVTSQYTALGFNLNDLGAALGTYLGFRWSHWGALFLLALAWPVVWLASGLPARRRLWAGVWIWLLAGLAIMLVQAKGYDYHWLPMLPPLALLGAGTLERLLHFVARGRPAYPLRALAAGALLATLAGGV